MNMANRQQQGGGGDSADQTLNPFARRECTPVVMWDMDSHVLQRKPPPTGKPPVGKKEEEGSETKKKKEPPQQLVRPSDDHIIRSEADVPFDFPFAKRLYREAKAASSVKVM